MLQSANISDRAKSIVANYFRQANKESIFHDHNRRLMASLFESMPQKELNMVSLLLDSQKGQELIINLLDYMTPEELEVLKSEYSAVIQYCYELYGQDGFFLSRSDGPGWIPQELVELCLALSQPQNGSSVFLPFAGEAQFGYYLPNCEISGYEPSFYNWIISEILLQSRNINANMLVGDHEILWEEFERKYDYIFTMPPFYTGNELRPLIDELYDRAVHGLNPNGQMYCILPASFCNASSGWFHMRKILSDCRGQFSAVVISLPKGLLGPVTNVELCLLVLIKDNENKVILVDATSSAFLAWQDFAGTKVHKLKVNTIIDAIKSHDTKCVWAGKPSELTDFMNLSPSRYLVEQFFPLPKSGEKLISLSEIVEVVPRERFEVTENGYQFIDIKSLSSNYLNCTIESSDIETTTQPKITGLRVRRVCDSKSLLFAYRSGKTYVGKLSGFDSQSTIALTGNTIPFKLKSDTVTEDFLLRSLKSDNVLKQIKMLNGSINERTQVRDFLSIRIVVPSLNEQQQLCKEDTRIRLTEADRKLLESAEEFRRDMHIKKHAIGQTISNFNNWWKILQRARKDRNGVLRDSDEVGIINKFEVSTVFENLQKIINQLQMQISRFDRGNGLVAQDIALTEFIEQYIESHKNPQFSYRYNPLAHRAAQDMPLIDVDEDAETVTVHNNEYVRRKGDPLEYVKFPPEALTIIFDNIISNACSHGFKTMGTKRFEIRIDIASDGTDYVVSISNNGDPISDKISQDEIYLYGRTSDPKSHSGIGAYEIKQLMREFDGDVRIVSTPSEDFTVTYQLVFHNTNIQYSI